MRAIDDQKLTQDPVLEVFQYLQSVENISELIGTAKTAWSNVETQTQKAQVKALYIEREKQLGGNGNQLKSIFGVIAKEEKSNNLVKMKRQSLDAINPQECPFVAFDENDRALNTIGNFESIMINDRKYKDVHYNLLGNYAEIHDVNHAAGIVKIRKWDDADEALSKKYIEDTYGIYSDKKHYDALRILFRLRAYNPVLDILNTLKWDGVDRCENFLHQWAKADDTPYVRECSRLIFAGGIWRIMEPGCKMDDVVVLIGSQGCGKSSLIRFLALQDDYFGEIKTIEGSQATEQLAGKWILEIPELAAFTKQKEVEGVKAFITRQKDSYRKPYDRNVDDRKRYCVFVGSTNNPSFLTDLTGNRRFYPVYVKSDGYEVYKQEKEIRQYIEQCWAEALVKFRRGEMPNYAIEDLREEYKKMQDAATQDDWRIGAIQSYLADKPLNAFVCVKELMDEVVSPDHEHPQNPTPRDSKDISIIMSRMKGWEKCTPHRTAKYGTQRGWLKKEESEEDYDSSSIEESDGLPF